MPLEYKGHVFDATCACCVGDAVAKTDPTGTAPLRRSLSTDLDIAWRQLLVAVRTTVKEQNWFGVKPDITQPSIAHGEAKIGSFQAWLDFALDQTLLKAKRQVIRAAIVKAVNQGRSYAAGELSEAVGTPVSAMGVAGSPENAPAGFKIDPIRLPDRTAALAKLAEVELQGIMEAVSQQSVRAVSQALLHNWTPARAVRDITKIVNTVGMTRSQAMVELMIVKAFNESVLDVYADAGHTQVDLVPEQRVTKLTTDAKKRSARSRKTGPGSRSSRKQTPSSSTIGRIEKAEAALTKLKRVNVRTAGDDDVCPICEDIADNGPYSINKARSLIPAHPRCRCTFVPVKDKRFAKDAHAGAALA